MYALSFRAPVSSPRYSCPCEAKPYARVEPKSMSAKWRSVAGRGRNGQLVERAPVPRDLPHELLVDAREPVELSAPPGLQRPLAEPEMAALLEPAVDVEHPVDRLHPVVGEEEHGRLLAVARCRRVDQLAAEPVDRLVHAQELVAGTGRRVRGMIGVEAREAEVADVVGAHEVDGEQAEVGLELKAELADAGHLLGVLDEALGVRGEVLPPALGHRVMCRDEIGIRGVDLLRGARRRDLRCLGAAVAGDDDAVDLLRRVRERDADPRRADACRAEHAPDRRAAAARRALELLRAAVRVRREVEDAVAAGVEARDERRPRGRRERGDRRAERSERALACETRDRGELALAHEALHEREIRAVEGKREDAPHRASTSR